MKLVAERPDVLLLAINFDENKAVVKALGVKVRVAMPALVGRPLLAALCGKAAVKALGAEVRACCPLPRCLQRPLLAAVGASPPALPPPASVLPLADLLGLLGGGAALALPLL